MCECCRFIAHKGFNMFGLVCACIAFSIALIYLHSDDTSNLARNRHRSLGYVVMVLGILQPINAFFRGAAPKNGDDTKSIRWFAWEWSHKILGYIAVLTAFFVMWIGINMGYTPIQWRVNTCVAAGSLDLY